MSRARRSTRGVVTADHAAWKPYDIGEGAFHISRGDPNDVDSLVIATVYDSRDADLIAAAPELLAALLPLLPIVRGYIMTEPDHAARWQLTIDAIAAINKARGKA